jgi:hypothetical protein
MTLKSPDIAARTYEDILGEMISSIPRYSEKWTNNNPSDPGITVLEILAWVFDSTLYRMNRIPEESYINFLRLMAGIKGDELGSLLDELKKYPYSDRNYIEFLDFLKEIEDNKTKGEKIKDINEMKAASLRFLNSNYRAVTLDNFNSLAIEATQSRNDGEPKIKRAIVKGYPDGKVEIIIISNMREKYNELKTIVREYLEPRRLICTKIVVKEPVYSSIKIYIEVAFFANSRSALIIENIRRNILEFLDPLTGGDDKTGWAYGRPVSMYELFHIIEETDGVDHANTIIIDDKPDLKIRKIEGLIDPVEISIKVEGEK